MGNIGKTKQRFTSIQLLSKNNCYKSLIIVFLTFLLFSKDYVVMRCLANSDEYPFKLKKSIVFMSSSILIRYSLSPTLSHHTYTQTAKLVALQYSETISQRQVS